MAKTFIFRAIYKGPAYAYATDPRFMGVSTSEKFWQRRIDATYEKYNGLRDWHTRIIQQVNATGVLINPTGRVYEFKRNLKGEFPEREIVNHPVQGLGADFMAIARVTAYNRLPKFVHREHIKFVNTVHDSVVVDANMKADSEELLETCDWIEKTFSDVPRNFERVFGVRVNVPLVGETKVGPTWGSLKKLERN